MYSVSRGVTEAWRVVPVPNQQHAVLPTEKPPPEVSAGGGFLLSLLHAVQQPRGRLVDDPCRNEIVTPLKPLEGIHPTPT